LTRSFRISQVVTSVEAQASGPSYTVPRLSTALADLGHSVHLLTLGPPSTQQTGSLLHTRYRQDFLDWPLLGRLCFSHELDRALTSESFDFFHTHGLWLMPNVYPAWAARAQGRPFLLSPRGMLGKDALQFSRYVKKLFWLLSQSRATISATCLHATSDQEYEDVRAYGLTQPVAVIPNGVDLPALAAERPFSATPTVLSLGRIHPKKGLDRLIRAWKNVEADFPLWCLEIIGPSEINHAEQLTRLALELDLKRVVISGPVFGEEKKRRLEEAEVFVLSTLNENFAMTVAESLALETPVISTKGAPWSGLETNGCGWWIDHGVEPLSRALREAMSLRAERRRAMGARGREWMARDFGWSAIALQMTQTYEWLYEGGEPPAFVRLD